MPTNEAKFRVGQLVHHALFSYRGVIFDADPIFLGSDAWYEANARSRPPRDRPWYHVLVHDADHTTYVAERNLEPDESGDPIRHPDVELWFGGFRDGAYTPRRTAN